MRRISQLRLTVDSIIQKMGCAAAIERANKRFPGKAFACFVTPIYR